MSVPWRYSQPESCNQVSASASSSFSVSIGEPPAVTDAPLAHLDDELQAPLDELVITSRRPQRLDVKRQQGRRLLLLSLSIGRSGKYRVVVRDGVLVGLLGLLE